MTEKLMKDFYASIAHNCQIADARYAKDYGLCTYLLKMREFYRWEKGLGFTDPIDHDDLGQWLCQRESLWEKLEDQPYQPIIIDNQSYDPFDHQGINQALQTKGLVYSAGLIANGSEHFYLAECLHREQQGDMQLFISGKEIHRCLHSPPAMSISHHIFLRQEALKRYLWEKYQTWQWKKPDNALARAFSDYDFERAPDRAAEQMAAVEMRWMLEHERGEYQASQLLGEDWNAMVLAHAGSRFERIARAIKDHLADALSTLPKLIAEQQSASLHFYRGNLNGMRLYLYPQFDQAYQHWLERGDWQVLKALNEQAQAHWLEQAQTMLSLYLQGQNLHQIEPESIQL